MTNETQSPPQSSAPQSSAPMTRRELEAKIIARAWSDDEFKAKFLADPKAMFEEHLGTRLPETLVLTAHEETAEAIHFVIPAKPRIDLDELSDEDLEKVAGGVDVVTTVVSAAIVSVHMTAGMAGSALLALITVAGAGSLKW